MLRRIIGYTIAVGVVFLIICIISVIQHWDTITQSFMGSVSAFISSFGAVFIVIIGIVMVLKSLRRR